MNPDTQLLSFWASNHSKNSLKLTACTNMPLHGLWALIAYEGFYIRSAWMAQEIELSGFTCKFIWTSLVPIELTVLDWRSLLRVSYWPSVNSMGKYLAWFPRIENYLFWAISVEIRFDTKYNSLRIRRELIMWSKISKKK